MHLLSLKHLVAATLLFTGPVATNHFYPRATISNYTMFPAVVEVRYAACKKDNFTIPAGTKDRAKKETAVGDDSNVIPGTATAPSNRGACLIRSITATLTGDKTTIHPYTSTGTSYSGFLIRIAPFSNSTTKVWSQHEWDSQIAIYNKKK